jgi:pyrroline-5-carboxylate reductase
MKIGFVGYGSMAEALAGKWVGKHNMFIGGRNEGAARALAERLGNGVVIQLLFSGRDHRTVLNVIQPEVQASVAADGSRTPQSM